MKRLLPLLLVFFLGCSGPDPAMEAALDLRSRCLSDSTVTLTAEIRADYIARIEEFTLECASSPDGTCTFRVLDPEDISDIRGTVRGSEGTVEFDNTVLAFPLMAEGRLSPLSGPWVLMKAIRSGCILAAGREGDMIHVTIDDSYDDHALTVDLWLEEGDLEEAEIAWEGRRCLSMTFDDFSA